MLVGTDGCRCRQSKASILTVFLSYCPPAPAEPTFADRRPVERGSRGFGILGAVALNGTAAYEDAGELPLLVRNAVNAARRCGFANSCLPSHGRLLQLLAGGVREGVIGETGTGCGVGLAWLASGVRPGVRLVSIDRDAALVETARDIFEDTPAVTVLHGDWRQLRAVGPFDLLALDGGGQGKSGQPPIEPADWLRSGGLVIIDDFTPTDRWPPLHDGRVDRVRLYWLQHPQLLAAEVRTQPDAATVIATFRFKEGRASKTSTDAAS